MHTCARAERAHEWNAKLLLDAPLAFYGFHLRLRICIKLKFLFAKGERKILLIKSRKSSARKTVSNEVGKHIGIVDDLARKHGSQKVLKLNIILRK
jgi:hypothetical protein